MELMQKKPKEDTKIISFRVSKMLYEVLEKYGRGEKDETGLPLNASTAARRLMLIGLKEKDKGK